MLEPRFVDYADTPPPGSQEEHARTMRVLLLLTHPAAGAGPLHLLNHDGREVLVSTYTTSAGPATSVESSDEGLLDVYVHGTDPVTALESAARLAVNVMSRPARATLRNHLLETR